MKLGRRKFIETAALAGGFTVVSGSVSNLVPKATSMVPASGPWLELSKAAYLKNAETISRIANDKPVLAVIKNNGYGLGDVEVAEILDKSAVLEGFALVKDERALALKKAGVRKPVLLMGDFSEERGQELARRGVVLSVFSVDSLNKIKRLARKSRRVINVALYVDTGLGRMGIPQSQAIAVARKVGVDKGLQVRYTFSTLTTPKDFAKEQINSFNQLINKLSAAGVKVGKTHLAPSFSMLDMPDSYQDMVRPGILLHGSYPLAKMEEAEKWPLLPTYRLKARVMRLEKLKAGDTIGFSRFYKVLQDEWIATLPVGWADGYDSGAENGAKVLLRGKLYPVVNVNASHANISLGSETEVGIGDVATLVGPDRPEITPEGFGKLVKGHNYLQINYKESIPKFVHESF